MIESEEQLEGERLAPGEAFSFSCHPGLSCFNTCCRDKRLPLLPYDVLRLRRGLALSSDRVLQRYAVMEQDPASGWPALRLNLDGEGRCPLVGHAGCTVYEHRPTCCRIYPLARAVRRRPGGGVEEVFLRGETGGCQGWDQPHELTVERWLDEQGLAEYQQANNRLLAFLLHPRAGRPMELDERQVQGVILGLYNLDVFGQLASQDAFAARFELEPARLRRALATDEALLELAQDWLTTQFFGP